MGESLLGFVHFCIIWIFIGVNYLTEMKLKDIIVEEITRSLLKENVSSLGTFKKPLETNANKILQLVNTLKDKNISNDMSKFIMYVYQVAYAVNRCVMKNSLHEALGGFLDLGSLRDYGLNIPPSLGGNTAYNFKRGFYTTKNFLNGRLANNQQNAMQNQYSESNLQSVSLAKLLGDINAQSKYVNVLYTKYPKLNNQQIKTLVTNTFVTLNKLNAAYQKLAAANPNP